MKRVMKGLYFLLAAVLAGSMLYTAFAQIQIVPTLLLDIARFDLLQGGSVNLQVNPSLYENGSDKWGNANAELKFDYAYQAQELPGLGFSLAGAQPGANWYPADQVKAQSKLVVFDSRTGGSEYGLYEGSVTVRAMDVASGAYAAGSTFSVRLHPADGALKAFRLPTQELSAFADGQALYLPVEDSWFTYYGSDESKHTVTSDKYAAYHMSLMVLSRSSGRYYTPEIENQNGRPVIKLTLSQPLGNAETDTVTMRMSTESYTLAGTHMDLTVHITGSTAEIAGPSEGTGHTPSPVVSPPQRMAVGSSLEFVVPDNNFVWLSGTDQTQSLALLNSNKDWISLSSDLSGLMDKEFYRANDSRGKFGIRLTARATGTVPAGATVSIRGNAAYALASPLEITSQISADGNRITGIASGAWLGADIRRNGNTEQASAAGLDLRPGDELRILLYSDMFDWQNGNPDPVVRVTRSHLSAARIGVRSSAKKYSKALDSVSIRSDSAGAYIEVDFADYLVSTSDRDFEVLVSFTENNRRHSASEVTLEGVLANEVVELYSNDSYVDLSEGLVAHAMEYIKSIEVDLGEDVTLQTRMLSGKKYYGYATRNYSEADDNFLREHEEVDSIYRLHTVGLGSALGKVKIDSTSRYYVYDAEGKYLGTTRDKLPFSDVYYLASQEVDLSGALSSGSTDPESGGELLPDGFDFPPDSGTGGTGAGSGSGGGNPYNGRPLTAKWGGGVAAILLLAGVALTREERIGADS